MPDQSYKTHRRLDPAYHFVAFFLLAAFLVLSGIQLWRQPALGSTAQVLLAIGVLILFLKTRSYALTVQDRLIRLEETLRMQRVLPADLQARIPELKRSQFVGLRFAADAELAERTREALAEGLDGEAIKKRIQVWRGDHFRV